jgi:hypothetical protein
MTEVLLEINAYPIRTDLDISEVDGVFPSMMLRREGASEVPAVITPSTQKEDIEGASDRKAVRLSQNMMGCQLLKVHSFT